MRIDSPFSEAFSIALHTCAALAMLEDGATLDSRSICDRFGFSRNHFAKVIVQLARAGLVVSSVGPRGGSRLAKPAAAITLADIHQAIEGTPVRQPCLLDHTICAGDKCSFGRVLSEARKQISAALSAQTLAEVAASLKIPVACDGKKPVGN